MDIDSRIVYAIIGVVSLAWLVVTIVSTVKPEVEVPPALNSVFLAVAGAAVAKLGGNKAKSSKDGDGTDKNEGDQ